MDLSNFHNYVLAKLYRDPDADPVAVLKGYLDDVRVQAANLRRMHELQDEVGRLSREIEDVQARTGIPAPK